MHNFPGEVAGEIIIADMSIAQQNLCKFQSIIITDSSAALSRH